MERNGRRPEFVPDESLQAVNTVEEQKAEHKEYWDIQHDSALAEKLSLALKEQNYRVSQRVLRDIVRNLRLTTY